MLHLILIRKWQSMQHRQQAMLNNMTYPMEVWFLLPMNGSGKVFEAVQWFKCLMSCLWIEEFRKHFSNLNYSIWKVMAFIEWFSMFRRASSHWVGLFGIYRFLRTVCLVNYQMKCSIIFANMCGFNLSSPPIISLSLFTHSTQRWHIMNWLKRWGRWCSVEVHPCFLECKREFTMNSRLWLHTSLWRYYMVLALAYTLTFKSPIL